MWRIGSDTEAVSPAGENFDGFAGTGIAFNRFDSP
jgi:hypothetical protein